MQSGDRYKTILLFGAPGAGKGTQGKILGAIAGFHHCACGDVFRSIDMKSELGKVFYEYSSRGELVPDDFTVKLWQHAIDAKIACNAYKPRQDLLILDGIPRTVEQARIMDDTIEVLRIVHLVCRDQEAMFERLRRRALKENRYDDADETVIRNRWYVYDKESVPVLNYYAGNLIEEVDSIGSPAQVLGNILPIVEPIQNTHFTKFEG